jgi:hypothetical protein
MRWRRLWLAERLRDELAVARLALSWPFRKKLPPQLCRRLARR